MTKTKEARPPGRPTGFSKAIATRICSRMAAGESLRQVCSTGGMPSIATVFRWLADERYKEFREQYEEARETLLETMAGEILEIADETSRDTLTDDEGNERANAEWIARSRLRVEARKWILSKLLPKKYGEKVAHEHAGGLTLNVVTGVVDPK